MGLPASVMRQAIVNFGGTDKIKDVEYIPNVIDIGECGEDMGPVGRAKISDTNGDGVADTLFVCDKATPLTEEYKRIFEDARAKVEKNLASFFAASVDSDCYKEKRSSIPPNTNVICKKELAASASTSTASAQLLDSNSDKKADEVALFSFANREPDRSLTSYTAVKHSITAQIRDTVDKMFQSGLTVEK
jgi:hypothetical protein